MISDKLNIREADHQDVSLLATLIRDSYRDVAERFGLTAENCPKHPSNCTQGWITKDFDRGVAFFILERNSAPVGCAALEKADSEACYLERLAVTPANRRNGFGKILVEHICNQAKVLEAKRISIGIIAEQSELKSWYRKLGFIDGETKEFPHLPFFVAFMTRDV